MLSAHSFKLLNSITMLSTAFLYSATWLHRLLFRTVLSIWIVIAFRSDCTCATSKGHEHNEQWFNFSWKILAFFRTKTGLLTHLIFVWQSCWVLTVLKVHKHEIFFLLFAETETLWSQGPVTRDFWKSYSIPPRYSTFKHFRACLACDEIGSQYAQHALKLVPSMLSVR